MREVEVDGSYGEGGGQILRTSAMLAVATCTKVRVFNIRVKRSNPGLRAQHVAVLRTLAEATGGRVEGLHVGSGEITFEPGPHMAEELDIDVGTAGSLTLLLQTVLPAASLSGSRLRLTARGGTDTRWSPTSGYFKEVVLPAFEAAGISASFEIASRGYYPRGGGTIRAAVEPAQAVDGLEFRSPHSYSVRIESVHSLLPASVGERQSRAALEVLRANGLHADAEVREEGAASPGTSVVIYSKGEGPHYVGWDSVGERGVPAEEVGRRAAEGFLEEVRAGSCVDRHLADILIPILAAQGGMSAYCTSSLTGHMETNAYVVSKFLETAGVRFAELGGRIEVRVRGAGLISSQP